MAFCSTAVFLAATQVYFISSDRAGVAHIDEYVHKPGEFALYCDGPMQPSSVLFGILANGMTWSIKK